MSKNKKPKPFKKKKPLPASVDPGIDQSTLVAMGAQYSGPLPQPKDLASYEALKEGLADRIVVMAETEQKHRHLMNKEDVKFDNTRLSRFALERNIGQFSALSIGVLAMIFAYKTAMAGHSGVASLYLGSGVLSLATAFIYGRGKGKNTDSSKNNK